MVDPQASSSTTYPGQGQIVIKKYDFVIVPAHRMWAVPVIEKLREQMINPDELFGQADAIALAPFVPYQVLKGILMKKVAKLRQGYRAFILVCGVEFRPADRVALEKSFDVDEKIS